MINMNSRVNKLGGALLSAVLLLAGICPSPAQTTNNLYWDFSNSATPTTGVVDGLSPTFSFGNAASLTYGTTTPLSSGYTNAAGFAASGGNYAVVTARSGATLDINASTYYSFSLSLAPTAGTSYSITEVSLGSRQSSSGPTTLALYESSDNSNFSFLSSVSVASDSKWAASDLSEFSISLPDDNSTVYFRLYGYGYTGTAGAGNWRIDDLAVTMVSVPVPEPSSVALAMLGGIACIFAFRRKRYS